MPHPSSGRLPDISSLSLVLLLVAAPTLAAQSVGEVTGRVTAEDHHPLVGAAVRIIGSQRFGVTDQNGEYHILGMPVGPSSVVTNYLGYRPDTGRVTVTEGGSAHLDFALRAAAVLLQGVTVLGQTEGQARALNQQRTSDVVSNVVAADQIGRSPDPNTAEALQRVPGIAIERDQGEGRYVLVRGTEPRLNGASINGVVIPSPESEVRAIALDDVPADVLASIEVKKTFTPDMDANAIGGAVNLVTRSAEYNRTTLNATFATGQNDLNGKQINQIAAVAGSRFGSDQRLGVLLGGSYYRTPRASNDIEQSWGSAGAVSTLGSLDLRDYQVTRTRKALNGTIDYDLSPADHLALRGLWSAFGDQEFRRRSRLRFDKGTIDPAASTVTGATIERELKDRYEIQRIYGVTLQGKSTRPRFGVDYQFAVSHAEEDEPHSKYITFAQKKFDFTYDLANTDAPRYTVTKGDEYDPTKYAFSGAETVDGLTTDRHVVGGLDVTVPLGGAHTRTTLQFGAKTRFDRKDYVLRDIAYDAYDAGALTMNMVTSPYLNRNFKYGYVVGQMSDPALTRPFITNNLANFEEDVTATHENSDPSSYLAHENVSAGYAMATIDVGRLRLIPGARLEATSTKYQGNVVTFDAAGDYASTLPVEGSQTYMDVLPGLNARFEIDDRTNLRAAVTRSMARPNYYDLVPYRVVRSGDAEIEEGNPDLRPTHAVNFDLMLERYFGSVGVISAGLFHKRLTDFITPTVREEAIDGTTYRISRPGQGDNATLTGFEVAWQQQLSMLPGPLAGLGVYANYTTTTSKAKYPLQDRSAELPGQIPQVANIALSYERYGFTGRVALNYNDRFVSEVGESSGDDVFYDRHKQLDVSASFRAYRGVRLFAEAINLTNEPLRYYVGTPNHPIQQEFYSWWAHFGVKIDASR